MTEQETPEEIRAAMLQKLNAPVTPVAAVPPAKLKSAEEIAKENYDADYDYARKKLKNLADYGEAAIEHFREVAEETGEPRAFEVLATLLKNTGELVKGVMDNAATKSTIDKKNEPQKVVGDKEPAQVTNTTIFVGTTKDLLDRINNEQQQKVIEGEVKEIK